MTKLISIRAEMVKVVGVLASVGKGDGVGKLSADSVDGAPEGGVGGEEVGPAGDGVRRVVNTRFAVCDHQAAMGAPNPTRVEQTEG